MTNNVLSFGISGTYVDTKYINLDDSAVPYKDRFNIQWNGDGFEIIPHADTSKKLLYHIINSWRVVTLSEQT